MDYQTLALTHFFGTEPVDTPAMTSEGLMTYGREPFASDSWIFAGTENEVDSIMEDTFDSIGASGDVQCGIFISKHWITRLKMVASTGHMASPKNPNRNCLPKMSDKAHTIEVMKRCKAAVPLSYGDIGAVAIAKKFKESERSEPGRDAACQKPQKMGQLTRQIWEDCQKTGNGISIPQLLAPHAEQSSFYKIEDIAKYAQIEKAFKNAPGEKKKRAYKIADVMAKIYREIGVPDLKTAIYLNRMASQHTTKPYSVMLSKNLSFVDLHDRLKYIDIENEVSEPKEEWNHYNDGIFEFEIMDDLAGYFNNELDIETNMDSFDERRHSYRYGYSVDYVDDEDADLAIDERTRDQASEQFDNTLGLYTYWNQSVIREDNALKNQRTNKLYLKIRNALLSRKVAAGNIPKLNKWIRRLTPAQKTSIRRAVRQAYGQAA